MVGGAAAALFLVVDQSTLAPVNWTLVGAYVLSGLVAGSIPLGLAEALGRLEIIQRAVAPPQSEPRSEPTRAGHPTQR